MLTLPAFDYIHLACCVLAHVHKDLAGVMVEAVTNDYESMDYSTETAGTVLETFVVLSSDPNALGSESQVLHLQDKDSQVLLYLQDKGRRGMGRGAAVFARFDG